MLKNITISSAPATMALSAAFAGAMLAVFHGNATACEGSEYHSPTQPVSSRDTSTVVTNGVANTLRDRAGDEWRIAALRGYEFNIDRIKEASEPRTEVTRLTDPARTRYRFIAGRCVASADVSFRVNLKDLEKVLKGEHKVDVLIVDFDRARNHKLCPSIAKGAPFFDFDITPDNQGLVTIKNDTWNGPNTRGDLPLSEARAIKEAGCIALHLK